MLSHLMLEKIRKHIIPLIIESVSDATDAYDITKKDNGDNFSDAYTFGTSCYGILKNRIQALLPRDAGFELEIFNNVLRIAWHGNDDVFRFHVYKVDALTRLFKGGNSVKTELRDKWRQCWLLSEASAKALAPDGYVNNLGYDASIESGLGSITIDKIRHLSGNEYEVETLHKFDLDHDEPGRGMKKDSMSSSPEKIRRSSPAYDPSPDAGKAVSE